MNFSFIWPIALVVFANTIYQICTKCVKSDVNPFASLTITYLIAAVCSGILFFVFSKGANLFKEYAKLNWASFVLGLGIIGLEIGFIYAYKAGWQVSVAAIVSSALLAIILIVVGAVFFKEAITWNKIVGILICLAGLFFINYEF